MGPGPHLIGDKPKLGARVSLPLALRTPGPDGGAFLVAALGLPVLGDPDVQLPVENLSDHRFPPRIVADVSPRPVALRVAVAGRGHPLLREESGDRPVALPLRRQLEDA